MRYKPRSSLLLINGFGSWSDSEACEPFYWISAWMRLWQRYIENGLVFSKAFSLRLTFFQDGRNILSVQKCDYSRSYQLHYCRFGRFHRPPNKPIGGWTAKISASSSSIPSFIGPVLVLISQRRVCFFRSHSRKSIWQTIHWTLHYTKLKLYVKRIMISYQYSYMDTSCIQNFLRY